MANKPVWIVCSPLKDYRDCPVGKDGDAMTCTECWRQYIDCEAISDE